MLDLQRKQLTGHHTSRVCVLPLTSLYYTTGLAVGFVGNLVELA